MSIHLDPKEVLEYLNELGYCNLSAIQLKEFMKDLKKLIKHDVRKAEKENVCPKRQFDREMGYSNAKRYLNEHLSSEKSYDMSFSDSNLDYKSQISDEQYVYDPLDVISSNLHSASTVSSRAKAVGVNRGVVVGADVQIPGVSFGPQRNRVVSASVISEPAASKVSSFLTDTTNDNRPVNKRTQSGFSLHRPKSFIRPTLSTKQCKSDPVSLYHQYQAEWKKRKMPGENYHKDLRWAVREKMLSAPSIIPVSTTSSRTRSSKRL